MKRPLLSVIIPTYNGRNKICRLIDSILIDSIPVEIIVVDDHSTDGTPAYINEKYGGKVLVIEKEGPNDPSLSRSQGFRAASGSFVVTMDDDDYVCPGYVANLIKIFDEFPFVDHVLTRVYIVRDNQETTIDGDNEEWIAGDSETCVISDKRQFEGVCSKRYGGWSHVYRKEYLLLHNYDYCNGELGLFALQFNDDCSSVFTKGSAYCYTINKNSLSHDIVKAVKYNTSNAPYCNPDILLKIQSVSKTEWKLQLSNYFVFKSFIPFLLIKGAADASFAKTRGYIKLAAEKYKIKRCKLLSLAMFFGRRTFSVSLVYFLRLCWLAWAYLHRKYKKSVSRKI